MRGWGVGSRRRVVRRRRVRPGWLAAARARPPVPASPSASRGRSSTHHAIAARAIRSHTVSRALDRRMTPRAGDGHCRALVGRRPAFACRFVADERVLVRSRPWSCVVQRSRSARGRIDVVDEQCVWLAGSGGGEGRGVRAGGRRPRVTRGRFSRERIRGPGRTRSGRRGPRFLRGVPGRRTAS